MTYTVTHIGRSTRQDGPDWTPKERAMDDTVCKGSFALGTACGKCSRCREEIEAVNTTLDAQMSHGGIQRYDLYALENNGDTWIDREPSRIGEWVRYDDLAPHVAALAAERDALAARVKALEADNANLSDKLELERALCDGAHRRARAALTGEAS